MIDTYLKNLNRTVEAGRKMGVTDAETFSSDEIEAIVAELAPLAELEMHDDVRDFLLPILQSKRFGDEVLADISLEEEDEVIVED